MHHSHSLSYFRCPSILLALSALLLGVPSRAQTDSSAAFGRLRDAYGVRIGIVGNWLGNITPAISNTFDAPPVGTGVRPSFNPYYETHIEPGLTAMANLMLVYRDFGILDLSDIRFESYGFNCMFRWEPAAHDGTALQNHFFFAPGLGFDTFDDRVSISLPLMAGELFPLSAIAELELSGLITPELFLGVGPGMYYGVTAGIRFLNPQ